MFPTRNSWQYRIACGAVMLFSMGAFAADRFQLLASIRLVLHDALSPGRLVLASIDDSVFAGSAAGVSEADSRIAAVETQLRKSERARRRLMIENGRLHNRLRQLDALPHEASTRPGLVGFELISVRVLSHHGMPDLLRQPFIAAGRIHGLRKSELVLDASGVLLDEGTQGGLTSGQAVLSGSVVIGRVGRAGRWVSQVEPVTDEHFTARIRLIRNSDRGTHDGPEGLFEGTGTGCRITGIPYTESVAVGDEVFFADVGGVAGPRLYLGQVVKVDFESGGDWSVRVEPAVAVSGVEQVAVVVPALDVARTGRSAGTEISLHGGRP